MKHTLSILFISSFLFAAANLTAQVTLYPTTTDTSYFKVTMNGKLKPVSRIKGTIRIVELYKNNELIERQRSSQPTGQLLQQEFYKSGRPIGKWVYYNEEGELISLRDFTKLVYGYCEPETVLGEGVVPPKFGIKEKDINYYLRLNIKYPAESRSLGTNGIVLINFIVDETGNANISHICGDVLDGYCDLVVWEVVEQMARWKPGTKDGKPVEMSVYLPVSFQMR